MRTEETRSIHACICTHDNAKERRWLPLLVLTCVARIWNAPILMKHVQSSWFGQVLCKIKIKCDNFNSTREGHPRRGLLSQPPDLPAHPAHRTLYIRTLQKDDTTAPESSRSFSITQTQTKLPTSLTPGTNARPSGNNRDSTSRY